MPNGTSKENNLMHEANELIIEAAKAVERYKDFVDKTPSVDDFYRKDADRKSKLMRQYFWE